MNEDTITPIVDGEIVRSSPQTTATAAETVITISNLITNYLTNLDRSQKELKEQRQMLEDAFGNDPTYKEHDAAAKAAAKVRSGTKAQILKQPQLRVLAEKVKDLREEMKANKEALSGYLQEYARLTGSTTFEGPDGEVQEIVYVAKLIKTRNR